MTAEDRLLRYLMNHPSGVSGPQLRAWLDSCRKDNGHSWGEQDTALKYLRDQGRIACTNGTWWLKDIPTAVKGLADDRKQLAKRRRESRADDRAGKPSSSK